MTHPHYHDPAVAATFGRVAVPAQFAQPARDLVAMLAIPPGAVVLDVGTGTGAFTRPASEAAGPSGFVVGVDPSLAMLHASDNPGHRASVVGQTPGLPFSDGRFDAVAASFVVHHCRRYEAALADMVRVCRPGGRVGITEWGTMPNLPGLLWKDLAAPYVDISRVNNAFREHVPWEEYFGVARNVERALADAGLTAIEVTTRQYTVELAPANFLAMKEAGIEGRLIRQMLSDISWEDFRSKASELFRRRFKDSVNFVRDVHLGVGSKA